MSAMYDTFRWMDEEEDLDLKFVLDDYHANLDGVVIPTADSVMRPSFRRQMSVTKMNFGRNSMSSPLSAKFESPPPTQLQRSKLRTISLMAPKHGPKPSIASIDPNAAHYQDPEARLKLRVYLASPQKFDEAIEFGFPSLPSLDSMTSGSSKENSPVTRISRDVRRRKQPSCSIDRGNTFFNDDAASVYEDDASMDDPESPVTPSGHDQAFRHNRGPSIARGSRSSSDYLNGILKGPTMVKQHETYSHAMAGSREMTLRMTLTRPDLRADENRIYGWQAAKSNLREESPMAEEKSDMRGPFGGVDGWGPDKENGGLKRLWQKVSRSQKKVY